MQLLALQDLRLLVSLRVLFDVASSTPGERLAATLAGSNLPAAAIDLADQLQVAGIQQAPEMVRQLCIAASLVG